MRLGFVIAERKVQRAFVADAGRLREILLDLVGNAIKFTDVGSVHVEVGEQGDPVGGLPAQQFL